MNCVSCKSVLIEKEYEGIMIDECPSCHSVWTDSGELDKIMKTRSEQFNEEQRKEALSHVDKDNSKDKIYSCPKCNTTMNKINYTTAPGCIVDICPKDCGIWLDAGELEKAQIIWEHNAAYFLAMLQSLDDEL